MVSLTLHLTTPGLKREASPLRLRFRSQIYHRFYPNGGKYTIWVLLNHILGEPFPPTTSLWFNPGLRLQNPQKNHRSFCIIWNHISKYPLKIDGSDEHVFRFLVPFEKGDMIHVHFRFRRILASIHLPACQPSSFLLGERIIGIIGGQTTYT